MLVGVERGADHILPEGGRKRFEIGRRVPVDGHFNQAGNGQFADVLDRPKPGLEQPCRVFLAQDTDRRDAGREDWQDYAREDWQEYAEDHYEEDDAGYYGDYYGEEEALVYWTLPCQPNVIALGGAIYYVCGSTWYIRAYYDGDVAYTEVPPPTGHQ